jgi:hypothetical protein
MEEGTMAQQAHVKREEFAAILDNACCQELGLIDDAL